MIKTRNLVVLAAAMISIVMVTSLASAAIDLGPTWFTQVNATNRISTVSMVITNTESTTHTLTFHLIDFGDKIRWLNNPPQTTFAPGESKIVIATMEVAPNVSGAFDPILVIRASPSIPNRSEVYRFFLVFSSASAMPATPSQPSQPSTIQPVFTGGNGSRASFCASGSKGTNLTITDVKLRSSGDDDEEWRLLDEVTIDVEVENTGTTDLEDIVVELGLFDSAGRNVAGKLDFSNDDEEKAEIDDLDDGDEEEVTFKFRVSGDMDDGNYKLALKAYSKKTGESNLCVDTSADLSDATFQQISVEREDDEGKFIAFQDLRVAPMDATCGDTVQVTAAAVNIGEDDQDRVKVSLSNPELKISLTQELRRGLDVGDDESVSFTFVVPEGSADKTYTFHMNAEYDYRNGVFRESLDAPHQVPVKVIGCAARAGAGQAPTSIQALQQTVNKTTTPEDEAPLEVRKGVTPSFAWILGIGIAVLVILIIIIALVQSAPRAARMPRPESQNGSRRAFK